MSITTTRIDEIAVLDASKVLAELACSPESPSVIRAAAEILPRVSDSVRRAAAKPGTEDDELLAVAIAVGLL
ncbi:hypothetical protein [Streptomyces sp. NBC_01304]|uniref:hypothetical protein n=1 Tax=Streptomyces sp. NBC_01304 TaxID=2903818 RepID=UPI002E123922|nr:hypothetical protein OG430_48955 [Streptomyces sp. NBC_01304]